MTRQLPLGVQLRDDATLDNFLFPPGSEILLPELEGMLHMGGSHLLYLHGNAGSGRSHLLQGSCHRAPAGRAQYLPLAQLAPLDANEVLADMEDLDLICLDDLDSIAGNQQWEEALFHFYNRSQDRGARLLCSALAPPALLDLQLADLRSRLASGSVYQLRAPEDAQKQLILQFRAARRGMPLTPELANYIMVRSGRSLAGLMEVLDQLDRDSLAEKRQLTVPFVRQSLGW